MYIFSGNSSQIDHTPEFRYLLDSITDIKREVTEFGQSNQTIQYNKLLKRVDALEQQIHSHFKNLNHLEEALATAAHAKLTEKQRAILRWLLEFEGDEVYTNLINRLSDELDIPRSTVRWNMKGLREMDLIVAGTKENKGVPVSVTAMGRIMANYARDANQYLR